MRFIINSTIGVGGIFDVARGWGYTPHSADFGMTFAVWGAPPGPYLFIPLLGPADLRDALSRSVRQQRPLPLYYRRPEADSQGHASLDNTGDSQHFGLFAKPPVD